MDSAMTWLTRGEMRGALSIKEFALFKADDDETKSTWSALVVGSAARYLKSATQLKVSVCGVSAKIDSLAFGGSSGDAVTLTGDVGFSRQGGTMCQLIIESSHPAFGSLNVSGWSLVPAPILDKDLGPSPSKLKQLAVLTGARMIQNDSARFNEIREWLALWGLNDGKSVPDKVKTGRDFYWPLGMNWIWLVLVLMPLEVLIRRWHLLMGSKING
jgi:hypothetical protein